MKNTGFARVAITDFARMVVRVPLLVRTIRREFSERLIVRPMILAAISYCFTFLFFLPLLALAQSQPPDQLRGEFGLPSPPEAQGVAGQPQQQTHGTVSGRIVDQTGHAVAGACVKLHHQETVTREVESDDDGQFAFAQVSAGLLQLTIVAEGFDTQTISADLRPGENHIVPQITVSLATQITEIHVSPSTEEIAQEQFRDLEKQRVLGFVPNFYVSYVSKAPALASGQKFQLALKATTDPVTIAAVGVIAGVDQATNRFSGYGQGAQAYAKRYGASYANLASGLFIGGAVLPSILKQDPRYFYRGTGTKRSRFLYAISRTVICKGDNQRWQPNYSSVLGDLAAGGISNLYIPSQDRHGSRLTFENAGIALGTTAVINVLQEFVLHKLTSKGH